MEPTAVETPTATDEQVKEANGPCESSSATASDEQRQKILKQIEFYFSDINIVRDKFMIAELEKNGGWLTVDCLMQFSRLNGICGGSRDALVDALTACKSSLVEFDPEGKVRRHPELTVPANSPEFWQKVKERSVVVCGFPETLTFDEVKAFCEKLGKVECVRLRHGRGSEKKFLGSAYVVFESLEEMEKFLNGPKPTFSDAVQLEFTKQCKFMEDLKAKKGSKQKPSKEAPPTKRAKLDVTKKKGVVVRLEGVPSDTIRKDVSSIMQEFGSVEWVDRKRGSDFALVRFSGDENFGAEVVEKMKQADGGVKIKDVEISARLLADSEEEEYWGKYEQLKAKKSN